MYSLVWRIWSTFEVSFKLYLFIIKTSSCISRAFNALHCFFCQYLHSTFLFSELEEFEPFLKSKTNLGIHSRWTRRSTMPFNTPNFNQVFQKTWYWLLRCGIFGWIVGASFHRETNGTAVERTNCSCITSRHIWFTFGWEPSFCGCRERSAKL